MARKRGDQVDGFVAHVQASMNADRVVSPAAPAAAAAPELPFAEGEAERDKEKDETFDQMKAAKERRLTLEWLARCPLGFLELQRILMEGLRVLFASEFYMNSLDFESVEQAKCAKAIEAGQPPKRDYALTLLAENRFERTFFGSMCELVTDGSVFDVIPEAY